MYRKIITWLLEIGLFLGTILVCTSVATIVVLSHLIVAMIVVGLRKL